MLMMISHAELLRILNYDPASGEFTWRERPVPRADKVIVGTRAGTICPGSGYRQIQIHRRIYRAHRLAWFYVHGTWPSTKHLDHINGIPDDNRIVNLRPATSSQNAANSRKKTKKTSRFKGVYHHKNSGLWCASVTKNYKTVYHGYFKTEMAAYEAYQRVASQVHGEFFNKG